VIGNKEGLAMSDKMERVMKSYGRCTISQTFFDDFYKVFLASSDEVRAMFRDTDFEVQKRVLREGLAFLIMFSKGGSFPEAKVAQLAERHSRTELNVPPEMYSLWLDAFLVTVAAHDTRCDDVLLQEWREVLQPGIDAMKAAY